MTSFGLSTEVKMWFKYSVLLAVALMAYQIVQIFSHVEFTNFKCTSFDKTFSDFEYCRIKAINRTYKYVDLKAKLFKVPITNVTVNVALMKRLNGYKPFLYNVTFDACKFLASKNKNPLLKYMHSFIGQHSNMNHSCPYDHDLIIDKVDIEFLNHQVVEVLPFPEGNYAVFTNWYAYGINRASVQVFVSLS